MTLTSLFFYLFAFIAVASAFKVISSRNPVHSVLFLILTFVNAAALFLLLGAEFLAMILLIVYVGAVAVLFLFVVMMLDVDFVELRQGFLSYMPTGLLVAGILLVEILFVVGGTQFASVLGIQQQVEGLDIPVISNTKAIGLVLYTKYAHLFQIAGLVLLVAMIGAIVLTLRHKQFVKRQNIHHQVSRRREDSVEVVKVTTGAGI